MCLHAGPQGVTTKCCDSAADVSVVVEGRVGLDAARMEGVTKPIPTTSSSSSAQSPNTQQGCSSHSSFFLILCRPCTEKKFTANFQVRPLRASDHALPMATLSHGGLGQASLRSAISGKPRIKVIDEALVANSRFGATVWTQAHQVVRSSFTVFQAHCSEQQCCLEMAPTSEVLFTSGRCHLKNRLNAIIAVALVIVLPRRTVKRQLTVGSLVETPMLSSSCTFSFFRRRACGDCVFLFHRYSAPGGLELRTRVRFHGLFPS